MNSQSFLRALLIVATLAAGMTWLLWRTDHKEPVGGLVPGRIAPAIEAEGWLNGEPPTAEQWSGEVVIVHGWFTSCRFCREETPELAQVYEQYRDRGVKLVSLTWEDERFLPQIRAFMDETGMDWLTGYGARDTLRGLRAEFYPCVWVIGRDGRVVWNRDSRESLQEALDQALAQTANAGQARAPANSGSASVAL